MASTVASNVTTELVRGRSKVDILPDFSPLTQKGLASRLWDELRRAWSDLGADPAGFIKNLFASDIKDARRRRLLYLGVGLALFTHVALAVLIVVASWHYTSAKAEEQAGNERPIWISEPGPPVKPSGPTLSRPKGGESGGNAGGGQMKETLASKGVLPPSSPLPPVVRLNP